MASLTPRVRMRDTELKPVDSLEQLKRGLGLVLTLTNPVVAVFSLIFTFILVRVRWARWALLAGLVASVGVFFLGGGRAYFTWVRDVKNFFLEHGLTNTAALGSFIGERWQGWLIAQLPLAFPVAVVVAGVIAWSRSRYKAAWREEDKERARTPKEQKSFEKNLVSAQKKMKPWPNAKPVENIDDLSVRVGTIFSTLKPFDIPLSALRLHTFIAGPSGFGKTTTILELIKGLVLAPAAQPLRIGTVFITMKPEPDITLALQEIAERSGRKVHIVTQDGRGATTTYNPLRYGTAAERRNIIINAEANAANGGFSEAHFLRSGSRFTLLALQALEVAVAKGLTYTQARERRPWRMDLEHVAKMMRIGVLDSMKSDGQDPVLADKIERYLAEVAEDDKVADGISGMRNRIAVIAEGAAGNVLVEEEGGLDLREAIKAGDIVIFNLNAARDLEASQYIANLAISDYVAALADLSEQGWHMGVSAKDGSPVQNRLNYILVDEFAALGGTGLVDVLERSRSYGGAALLSTQSYSALEDVDKGFKDRLMTNTTVKLFHQIDVKADELAEMLGTRQTMKETFQTFEDKDLLGSQSRASGQGTVREVEVFNLHPNTLRSLNPGEIVGVIKTPRFVEKVKVRKTGINAPLPPKEESSRKTVVERVEAEKPLVTSGSVAIAESSEEEVSSSNPWEQVLSSVPAKKADKPVEAKKSSSPDDSFLFEDEDDDLDFPV